MSKKEKVIAFVDSNSIKSGNHSGLSLPIIIENTHGSLIEIRNILNILHKEGRIKVRDGINGKLVFKNK